MFIANFTGQPVVINKVPLPPRGVYQGERGVVSWKQHRILTWVGDFHHIPKKWENKFCTEQLKHKTLVLCTPAGYA